MKHNQPVVADIARADTPRNYRQARELALRIVKGIYPVQKFGDGFTTLTEEGQLHRVKVVYADPAPLLKRDSRFLQKKPQQFFWMEVDTKEREQLAAYFRTLADQLLDSQHEGSKA